jgi:CHAT domain-containing protein
MLIGPMVVAIALAVEGGPSEVSRAFFNAYAGGDVEHAAGYWKSGTAERFRVAARRTATARCFVIRRLDVRVVESNPEHARVEIDAAATTWSATPDAVPAGRSLFKTIELEHEDNAWKVVAVHDREETLAVAIAAAPPERRAEIARSAPALRTPLLALLIARRVVTMVNQARFADAGQLLEIAQEIAWETGDGGAEADVTAVRGTWARVGPARDLESSMQFAQASVEWAEATKDPDVLARTLLRQGRTRSIVLRRVEPGPFERVVALADRVEDVAPVAQAYAQLSGAASDRDDARESLHYAILAAKYAAETDDLTLRLDASYILGTAFWKQGDLDLAAIHLERAIALAREAGFVKPLAGAMDYLALVHLRSGRAGEFLKTVEEALALGDPDVETELRISRASYRIGIGDFAGAEADLDAVEKSDRFDVAERRNAMNAVRSRLLLKQGRCEEALRIASAPCRYEEGCGPPIERVHALQCLGRNDEAETIARQILDDQERQRSTSSADTQQLRAWQEEHATFYESIAELFVDQKRAAEALIVADRSKARILSDTRKQLLLAPSRLTGSDRAAYDRLNQRIGTLNRAIFDAANKGQSDTRLRADLDRARTDLRELLAQTDPSLHGAPSRATRSVADEIVPAPPADVVVIEFLSTESRLLAFAVTRSASGEAVVAAQSMPVPRADLKQRVDRYLAAIEQRDLRFEKSARELYDLLLAPFEPLIRTHRALCVIPAGDLWRVPFHALKARNGRYLIEAATVFYAPSIAALELMRAQRAGDRAPTLLALANPNVGAKTQSMVRAYYPGKPVGAIPETEREVRALAPIYGRKNSRIYIGDDAQEGVLKRESPNFSVLHIAAHGILDENAPWFSALALSSADDGEDGLLEAREIAELPLHADLAVLSACETGRGRASGGEGVIGFSWALLAAGCPNAVVSQWRTDSESTAELMIRFHRDLVRTGRRSPSESLRRAQLSMMRRDPHPYYWAPFIVVGRGN